MLNYQFLYKQGSLKKVKKTTYEPKIGERILDNYEVKVIQIHNFNIDAKGSALIEKFILEVVLYKKDGEQYEHKSCRQSRFFIVSYSKLEELMLSPDWIMIDSTSGIKEKIKTCTHAKKEV